MLISVGLTLSIALLSRAQATNNTQLGIEAIEAHFKNAQLVPSLIDTFGPSATLTISYNGVGQVQPGQKLTVDQVKPPPSLSVVPANSSVMTSGNYTLAMVDADVVGNDESKGQTRHWLVNGVTIKGNIVDTSHALNITNYASPLPPAGSGPHRYVILLYVQPSSFIPSGALAQANQPVGVFDLKQYVATSQLGWIFAATYYDVEQGTASASLPATLLVITSTLPAAAAATTASGSLSSSAPQSSASGKNGASVAHNLSTGFAGLLAFFAYIVAA